MLQLAEVPVEPYDDECDERGRRLGLSDLIMEEALLREAANDGR